MCLILFAWEVHPDYRLILAANRDEFHARPTAPAVWWRTPPGVLAGRDLAGGGTWFGIDRRGRWAAVTNFRDPVQVHPGARSRGLLVRDYLATGTAPSTWLAEVVGQAEEFRAFNLLAGDCNEVAWFGSRDGRVRVLPAGIYGLSNALLDTPWPKVTGGKAALAALLGQQAVSAEALLNLLADQTPAPDAELPATGVGRERERLLSSRFIRSADYGTRCSTVLLVGVDDRAEFHERRFAADGSCQGEVRESFRLLR
jgi:uncharacterized protein with NRDE domain